MSEAPYDPFNEVDDSYARARKIDTLEKGVKYSVTKLYPKKSDWKDEKTQICPINTHCVFLDGDMVCTTILPKKFNDKNDKWYNVMNELISTEKGPKVVYYGKVGLGNEVDLLRHTQDVDQKRLQLVASIEEREAAGNLKRKNSDNDNKSSPMKRMGSSSSM